MGLFTAITSSPTRKGDCGVLGEGIVLVMSDGTLAGRHNSFYDLSHVQKGKIAGHWGTIEHIPAREQWKNSNGKF